MKRISVATILWYLMENEYINELFIYTTLPSPPNTISIHYNLIKEKIAYGVDNNLNSLYEFHAFPNILEST